jgi:hypothetical protein
VELATEQGDPYTVEHAICMHEEDYGSSGSTMTCTAAPTRRRSCTTWFADGRQLRVWLLLYLYLDNIQLARSPASCRRWPSRPARCPTSERRRERCRRAASPAHVQCAARLRRRRRDQRGL